MQIMHTLVGERSLALEMPLPDEWIMPGIRWGRFEELFTAAYWHGQAWQAQMHNHYGSLKLGRTLAEEVAACLLGGYGMKAEIGLAAYRTVRDLGMLRSGVEPTRLELILSEPIMVRDRLVRYRFPRQKAQYLAGCMDALDQIDEASLSDTQLREALVGLPGIGPKTASWIVRNYRHSDSVAVLDVHIIRAGQFLGLFSKRETPQRDYRSLEARFLHFAEAIKAPASLLDALMWQHMRLLQYA
ncbi:Thermostable 8-oxoguanine DNA glycosylase [Bosea sp. OK403]|uniref:8-oxoguanine DNA glycosylase n=1 Tax=Bosea sp. OK403 TaxID=1855286 RepID=UPI0008EB7FB3|nr:hypothetical protein [Bosea sp. OK403]SFJ77257.1 Thermostable 8-oxoguanine DNA glycosylase [Bosea sp. OK403]